MTFQPGDTLWLEIRQSGISGKFRSKVLKTYASWVIATAPLSMGHPVEAVPGTEVKGFIIKKDATYSFITRLLYSEYKSPEAKWFLAWPQQLNRMQRRRDVRIEIHIPVEIWVTQEENGKEFMKLINGRTLNLSAGGSKIETEEKIRGKKVEITFYFPEMEKLKISAAILRDGPLIAAQPGRARARTRYWTAFKFLEISEEKKRRIIQFIFRKQQELRLKGLI